MKMRTKMKIEMETKIANTCLLLHPYLPPHHAHHHPFPLNLIPIANLLDLKLLKLLLAIAASLLSNLLRLRNFSNLLVKCNSDRPANSAVSIVRITEPVGQKLTAI